MAYKIPECLPISGGNITGAVTTTSTLQFKTLQYTTGTISQSGFNISGSGTTFTSAMDGGWLIPSSGTAQRYYFNGSTTGIGSLSQTIAAGTTFTLYYNVNDYIDQDQKSSATIFSNNGFLVYGNSSGQFINNGLSVTRKGFYADVNAFNPPFNPTPGLSVSQSGTTITGIGTSFTSDYKGRLMIFTTGQSAFITAVNSTTSLTASVSQTVPSTSYQMAGQTTSAATCMDAIGNFGAKNLYVYSTLNLPNGTFSIGGNTAFSGAFTFTGSLTGNTGVTFPTSGTLATTSQLPTPSALTKTDDTNVTLTLGGTPTTALLQATSLTLGWTGQLSAARGGTGANNTATSGTILRGNGTNFVPTTATYPSTFVINDIPYASSANVLGVITAAANSVLAYNGSSIPSATATLPSAVQNNITAVNSAANTLSIGGSTKTFTSGAVNVPSATNVSSWTPGISFGNGTTGLTYGFQSGQYSTTVMPNGQIKTECWASLGLSAKGTSTGIARITGFPTSTGSNGAIYIFASAQENISTVAGSTLFCDMSASGTTAVIRSYSNNAANTTLSDTNFTNNSVLKFYAVYWNN